MINLLTNTIYDTKDKTDKIKDDMKRVTKCKIPQLNEQVQQFQQDIQDRMFLDMPSAGISNSGQSSSQ